MKFLNLIVLALIASLAAGCGGGSSAAVAIPPPVPTVNFTKAVYAPTTGNVPIPNDLLFSETQDFTLNGPVADPADLSDPLVGIQAQDGWSTHTAFRIAFENAGNAGLDLSTIIVGQTLRIFKVTAQREELTPGVIAPTGAPIAIEAELGGTEIAVELAALDSNGLTLLVTPLVPFEPQATYMVAITNDVQDINGNALIEDDEYTIAKGLNPIPAGDPNEALEPVRLLVDQMLSTASAAGVDRDSVVLIYHFTVQSVGATVLAAKQTYVDLPIQQGVNPLTSFSSLFTDTAPFTGLGAADLYKGQLSLPYYSTAPSPASPTAPLDEFWVGATTLPDPGDPTSTIPNPGAGAFLTYANPVPQVTGTEQVPLFVSIPKVALGCPKPAPGYPVTIFLHGITSDRTSMLGIADFFAAPPTCHAVVAMDLPLHGIRADNAVHLEFLAGSGGLIGLFEGYAAGEARERTFGVDFIEDATGALGMDGSPDPSGLHFMNFRNLLVSRDNLRQAISDLLALEKAIPFMDIDGDTQADFDADRINFVGHSLGGIVGSSYAAYSDYAKTIVLANAGGGLTKLLTNSDLIRPVVEGILSDIGIEPGSAEFESFLFAAQTVIDTGDPVSTATLAATMNIPTLALQVADDPVVPNAVAEAPLSGSEPLADLLGLQPLLTSTSDAAGLRAFARLTAGDHSSMLSPFENLAVTIEMQRQIVTFVDSGGTDISVTDTTLLE